MRKNYLRIIIISLVVVWFGFKLVNGFFEMQEDASDVLPTTFKLGIEERNLVHERYWDSIQIKSIFNDKKNGSFSTFTIIGFDFLVHKIKIDHHLSFDSMKLHAIKKNETVSKTYRHFSNGTYNFYYMMGSIIDPTFVDIYFDGGAKLVEKDSAYAVILKAKTVSICYNHQSLVNLYIKSRYSAVPLYVTFRRTTSGTFLIVMTAKGNHELLLSEINKIIK